MRRALPHLVVERGAEAAVQVVFGNERFPLAVALIPVGPAAILLA